MPWVEGRQAAGFAARYVVELWRPPDLDRRMTESGKFTNAHSGIAVATFRQADDSCLWVSALSAH